MDDGSLLFAIIQKLPLRLEDFIGLLDDSNISSTIRFGIMKLIPSLLLSHFDLTLDLLLVIFKHEEVPLDSFFLRKNTIFFFIEKIYEILREDYENRVSVPLINGYEEKRLRKIIQLFTLLIQKDKNLHLLVLLFNSEYFTLINSINTIDVMVFYNSVFYFRAKECLEEGSKYRGRHGRDVSSDGPAGSHGLTCSEKPLLEINRKQFDPEVPMKDSLIVNYRSFTTKYDKCSEVHVKIADNIVRYNLPMIKYSLKEHFCDCGTDIDPENPVESPKPLHLLTFLGIGFLTDTQDILSISGYLNLFKGISKSEDKVVLFKKLYNPGILKNIYNVDYELRGIELLCILNELHREINISNLDLLPKMRENNFKYVVRALEYEERIPDCMVGECKLGDCIRTRVLFLLREIVLNGRECLFYKISYLFLLKSLKLSKMKEHCCETKKEVFEVILLIENVILDNLRRNPYNFAQMLFSFEKSRSREQGEKGPDKDESELSEASGYSDEGYGEEKEENRSKLQRILNLKASSMNKGPEEPQSQKFTDDRAIESDEERQFKVGLFDDEGSEF